jgi:hypothetical protein
VRFNVQDQLKGRNILSLILIRCSMHSSCPIETAALFFCFSLDVRETEEYNTKTSFFSHCLVSPENCPIGGLESYSVLLIGCLAEKPNEWHEIIIILQK